MNQTTRRQQIFNMQVLICALMLNCMLIVSRTDAAASYGHFRHPDHPGKCYINETLILSPGETIQYPNACMKGECLSEKGEFYMVSCGVVAPPPNCHVVFNKRSEPYPTCCHFEIVCDSENVLVDNHERTLATEKVSDLLKEEEQSTVAVNIPPGSAENESITTTTIADNLELPTTTQTPI